MNFSPNKNYRDRKRDIPNKQLIFIRDGLEVLHGI